METQIGNLESADLEKGTLTICVGDDIEAVEGHYAVVPIAEYTRLNNIANKQLETTASDISQIVMPRYCFSCGSKLEKLAEGCYQCENDNCSEVMFAYKTDKGLMISYIQTPASPPNEA